MHFPHFSMRKAAASTKTADFPASGRKKGRGKYNAADTLVHFYEVTFTL